MIADWRSKWHAATDGRTDALFPFGFVQLNSIGNKTVYNDPADPGDDLSPTFGYAGLRWSQTASYGYVPNPAMPAVFMAVSLDTPDRPSTEPEPHSAGFNVHSPFKQPTAARLARAGLSVGYGMPVAGGIGPVAGDVTKQEGSTLVLSVLHAGEGVVLHSSKGFEVLANGKWQSAPVVSHTNDTVTVGEVPPAATKLRYNWYSNPCGEQCFGCAVYVSVPKIGELSGEEPFLPLAPFIKKI